MGNFWRQNQIIVLRYQASLSIQLIQPHCFLFLSSQDGSMDLLKIQLSSFSLRSVNFFTSLTSLRPGQGGKSKKYLDHDVIVPFAIQFH